MTKFDIRLRRRQFTQSRIDRYKNYQSILERHHEARKKKTRGVMVIAILIILIVAILLAFFGTLKQPTQKSPDNQAEFLSEDINANKFYELKIYKS